MPAWRAGDAEVIFYFELGGKLVIDAATGRITGWQSSWFTKVDSEVSVYAVCAS